MSRAANIPNFGQGDDDWLEMRVLRDERSSKLRLEQERQSSFRLHAKFAWRVDQKSEEAQLVRQTGIDKGL